MYEIPCSRSNHNTSPPPHLASLWRGRWILPKAKDGGREGVGQNCKKEKTPSRAWHILHRREMTLDHCIFHLQQPRVISVLSYYLTSVINLSFFRLDIVFRSTGFHSEALLFVPWTHALSELFFMSSNFSGIRSLCLSWLFGLSRLVLPVHRVSPFLMLI